MEEMQVWQRVFSPAQLHADPGGLAALLSEAARTAALCREFQRMGPAGQKLSQLQQENLQCLRGLCRMVKAAPPGQPGTVRGDVKTAYYRCQKAMTEYAARSAERDFGAVFQEMSRREAQCCTLLAQLAGI